MHLNMANMRIVSWNVQGLGGSVCNKMRERLRLEVERALTAGLVDILLIQEHHLSQRRIDNYGSILPGHWLSYWSSGIGNSNAQAGVCFAIAEKWKSNVVHYEELIPGRAQSIMLEVNNDKVGFLNVYAPNSSSARASFWSELTSLCSADVSWCVGGDFNMIERVKDRTGGSMVTVHGQELASWERFCFHLHIMDTWTNDAFVRMKDSLYFSRSNRRQNDANLARLDRFYVSSNLAQRGGQIGIMAGTTFSDHAPVLLLLKDEVVYRKDTFRIPDSIIRDATLRAQVETIWNGRRNVEDPVRDFMSKIEESSELFRLQEKERYSIFVQREKALRSSLSSSQRLQEKFPNCKWIGDLLYKARMEIMEMEARRTDAQLDRKSAE